MLYKLMIHGLTPRPIEHFVGGDRTSAERQAQNIIMSVKAVYVTVYVMEVSYEGRVNEVASFQTGS